MDNEPSILECITSKGGSDIGSFFILFKCIHAICTVSEEYCAAHAGEFEGALPIFLHSIF